MKFKKIKTAIFLSLILITIPLATQAAGFSLIDPNNAGYKNGDYTLNDGVNLIINVAEMILKIVGILTFAMFVYGGFIFLISTGNSKQLDKAKKIILAAVTGLIIVFVSKTFIDFFIRSLTTPQ